MTDTLQSTLQQYLRQQMHPDAIVTDIKAIADGWETEVHAFTLERGGASEKLILRMYPGGSAAEKCAREANAMAYVRRVGYPVPEVLHHALDATPLGKPFLIMQFIDSTPMGKLFQAASPERMAALIERYAKLMVWLHRITIFDVPKSQRDDPYFFIRKKLSEARTHLIDGFQRTEFAPVLDWLGEHAESVPCPRLSLVHTDFHPFNILTTPDDHDFVIDWSTVEVADYRYDLGWSLMLAGTYGGRIGQRDMLLAAYEAAAGQPVEHIEYFEVLAALRRLFSVVTSMSAGAESLGMRPEAVEMMRGQGEHLRAVYGIITLHTGLALPEIESWLETLNA